MLDIQSHGRNLDIPGADLTRTVGYFTEMIAQPISADRQLSFKESLKRFQSKLYNTFLKSKNYGLLRYISEDQEISQKMKQLPKPEIGLNFMPEQTGDRDESSPFHVIEFPNYENDKIWQSPKLDRIWLIYIYVKVKEKQIELKFVYSEKLYKKKTFETLTKLFFTEINNFLTNNEIDHHTFTFKN